MLQERLTWAFPVGSMARPVPSPTAAWRSQLDNSKAAGAEHCATAAAAPLRQALGEARRCPGGSRAGLSVPPVTAWQGGARTELPPPPQRPRAPGHRQPAASQLEPPAGQGSARCKAQRPFRIKVAVSQVRACQATSQAPSTA